MSDVRELNGKDSFGVSLQQPDILWIQKRSTSVYHCFNGQDCVGKICQVTGEFNPLRYSHSSRMVPREPALQAFSQVIWPFLVFDAMDGRAGQESIMKSEFPESH